MSLLPSGVDCYPFHVLHIGLFTDQLRAGMLLVWWGVEFILPGPCEAVLLTQYHLPLHSSTASQGHQGISSFKISEHIVQKALPLLSRSDHSK